ncbi:MAG TPA: hypothetical protein VJ000_01190 [Thermodesulfovibrionia bacterium]|nr:MAG: hypothetical protein A2Z57_10870 [Planctomycetes bacterium RIFCSPHIGHO2_12_39_6]HLA49786.1 hypothetical protein [Thermodesulfovibrionia bacterium]
MASFWEDAGKVLFGNTEEDYYRGQDYLNQYGGLTPLSYTPQSYTQFDPTKFGGGVGQGFQQNILQYLSGQLSPAQQQQLSQQYAQNLASIREGAYGMPIGAQKGLEYQSAGQNALQAAILGEQQRQLGMNYAFPYIGMGQQENRYGQEFGQRENQFGYNAQFQQQQLQQQLNQYLGNLNAAARGEAGKSQGLLGTFVSAATPWVLGGGAAGLFTGGAGSTGGNRPTSYIGERNPWEARPSWQ